MYFVKKLYFSKLNLTKRKQQAFAAKIIFKLILGLAVSLLLKGEFGWANIGKEPDI